jgi:predicted dehydrogenase
MVRIGVIGAGRNGSGHARYYRDCPRSEVVAVADPDAERAEALAAECGAEALAGFAQMLDGVDAVVISSPNHLHRDHAVACAGAGRHVYCEKPMGVSAAQADEIAEAVREAGVRSTVGFSVRFSDVVQTMQRYVAEGSVGELVSLWSRRMSFLAPRWGASWRADHELSGGVLLEINVHELDWLMAIGGPVESVYARVYAERETGPRANDHNWVILNFAAGAVGTHEGSHLSPVPVYERGLVGTRGGLQTADWGNALLFVERGGKPAPAPLDQPFDLRAHFLDCVEGGVPAVADAEWGCKVMHVAEAVLRSARTGEVQQVAT